MKPLSCDYTPKFRKRKMGWENSLCLGLEIELEHESSNEDIRNASLSKVNKKLQKLKTRTNPFYYKRDGSLSNGVEFVAQPMTLQYIHNKTNMYNFFETIINNDFIAKSCCGIHVHLSKDFFKPIELIKLRMFFSINKKQLIKFSQRNGTNIDKWAKIENYSVNDFLHGKKTCTGSTSIRSSACSFASHLRNKTIEIRLFNSTTNHKRFIAITQFCDAIGYFVKDIGIGAISKQDCWKTFVNWCEQKNRYNNLIEEFENEHLAS